MRAKTKKLGQPFLTGSGHDWPWKRSKFVPFVDRFIRHHGTDDLTLSDIRGGAKLRLKEIPTCIEGSCGAEVNKFALGLNHGAGDLWVNLKRLNVVALLRVHSSIKDE